MENLEAKAMAAQAEAPEIKAELKYPQMQEILKYMVENFPKEEGK